jgi:hypothetical protein
MLYKGASQLTVKNIIAEEHAKANGYVETPPSLRRSRREPPPPDVEAAGEWADLKRRVAALEAKVYG